MLLTTRIFKIDLIFVIVATRVIHLDEKLQGA